MTTSKIIKMLCARLTNQDLLDLYIAMDEDGPAGPLYCALNDHVAKLFPEEFIDSHDLPEKIEIQKHHKGCLCVDCHPAETPKVA